MTVDFHIPSRHMNEGCNWLEQNSGWPYAVGAVVALPTKAQRIQSHNLIEGLYREPSVMVTVIDSVDYHIQSARWILDIQVDIEAGERPFDEETFARAGEMCKRISRHIDRLPSITPAEDGSIDLHWRAEPQLLINIPADPSELPTYFGSRKNGATLSGEIDRDLGTTSHLRAWLTGG